MKPELFLIDGTAIIYRAYYAFIRRPLFNSRGVNTSAIYGTINTFMSILQKYNPRFIAISFDRKEPTFRHELTETYKANRPPVPEELLKQIKPIQNFFQLIGINHISKAGYEADDILATLAHRFKNDFEVIIVTGDKDFVQILKDDLKLYDPFKESILAYHDAEKKYCIKPEQFTDYLALVGDSADNIPGVKGIGDKTAVKLLKKFENLDLIYSNLENIKPESVKNRLEIDRENAYLSKKLATIEENVDIKELDSNNIHFKPDSLYKASDLLKEYELGSLLKKIQSLQPKNSEVNSQTDFLDSLFSEEDESKHSKTEILHKCTVVNNEETLSYLLNQISEADTISLDTETTSTDPISAELVGISICTGTSEAFYLPFSHHNSKNLELLKVIPVLKDSINGKTIICHNLKYDYLILKKHSWIIEGNFFDTMIASYLCNPEIMNHSLENCSLRELQYSMISIKELIGTGQKQITFDQVELSRAAEYSTEDAFITFKLYPVYLKKLKQQNLHDLFLNIELPLVFVLAEMEENGVFIDKNILKHISHKIDHEIQRLSSLIYKEAGTEFNLNSTQQLSQLLFEKLKLPVVKKVKTGYSTDNSVLEKLSDKFEIARLIMDYRNNSKLNSTYVKALPKLINPATKRIHSSFNQTITSTGRLSSSKPNLQNIPVRSSHGKEIRKAFCPADSDFLILSADYSQIELRIFAMLSNDNYLVSAFRNKEDVHAQTAGIIFGKPLNEVNPDDRRKAKVINFGIIYGMGSTKLSKELNISTGEAKDFIENYYSKFTHIRQFMQNQIMTAKSQGYVTTLFGRKLTLPNIRSTNTRFQSEAERVAINMPIQGSAADLIKIAMINIHKEIVSKKYDKLKMLIQVHDELVFEVHRSFEQDAEKLIRQMMENALPERYKSIVPLQVDIGIGKNWYEAH